MGVRSVEEEEKLLWQEPEVRAMCEEACGSSGIGLFSPGLIPYMH